MMNTNAKKVIQISSFLFFFLFIVIYAFFRSQDLIFGVKITGVNLVDGSKVENTVLKVVGNAQNAVNLTLNGREIPISKDGDFNETIALLSGYNIINITARDKFGNIDKKNYKLMH